MMSNMSNGNSAAAAASQACAACKFQRRKCPADCPLAPYFPAEANQRFLSCKRLFGVSNMLRFLRDAEPGERDATMKSLIYEAEVRDKDPVHGCLGIISRLSEEVKNLRRELEIAKGCYVQQARLPSASLLQHSELAAQPLIGMGSNTSHPLALPLSSYRHSSGPHLALDDPFDFETHMDHKYLIKP